MRRGRLLGWRGCRLGRDLLRAICDVKYDVSANEMLNSCLLLSIMPLLLFVGSCAVHRQVLNKVLVE
jgi:hypothetical protein